jgi:ribosome maturation protein Sdo1
MKIMVEKGEIQFSTAERREMLERKRLEIGMWLYWRSIIIDNKHMDKI